ncbi:hypothetical protein JZ751_017657 [Albula glossodonta]|uniref:Uncharacterized protein n=1 Tax=Albula glossodonta TaxID=121402 RepID=A0A8T2PMJ7_9TELE|nr:hypothetical protein JZ751_017657 [Albula glossodonta]
MSLPIVGDPWASLSSQEPCTNLESLYSNVTKAGAESCYSTFYYTNQAKKWEGIRDAKESFWTG